ncbi:MAG: YeeE/YedE thiosulfate transporter family protein [Deltaproteobacteria bacterium]|nr:YeeE/YedE thiosulfate transporter family protein [Deltaproteobacteria bacterium]
MNWSQILSEPWPWWLAALGLVTVSTALLLVEGRRLGVSSGLSALLGLVPERAAACGDGPAAESPRWRGAFLLGLPLGGLASGLLGGDLSLSLSMGSLGALAGGVSGTALLLLGGGVLIGWGTRQGGGCTSGHGIVGCALGRRTSLAATGVFFLVAALTSNLLHLLGGLTP